jgi:hypothetical protein
MITIIIINIVRIAPSIISFFLIILNEPKDSRLDSLDGIYIQRARDLFC